MNYVRLSFTFLIHKPLLSILSIALILLPVTIITSVLLFNQGVKKYYLNSISGIDIILAARSNPEQIILNNIFFSGPVSQGIDLEKARKILKNPNVQFAVPVSINYNYHNYRIVGTNMNFRDLFRETLLKGNWWTADYEMVLGYNTASQTGLKVGDIFYCSPGTEQDTLVLKEKPLRVAGILGKMNNSTDNIILTTTETSWNLEGYHEPDNRRGSGFPESKMQPSDYFPFEFPANHGKKITSVLIKIKIPESTTSFIKDESLRSDYEAVSPVNETAKIYNSLQYTLSAITWSGYSILIIGLLALLVLLFHFVQERSDDLFQLRILGASKTNIMFIVILQGILIADVAAFSGILLAHVIIGLLSISRDFELKFGISGTVASWKEVDIYIFVLFLGFLVSIFPALKTRKLNDFQPMTDN